MGSDVLVQEVIFAIISLVVSLFHLEQLKTCYLPVHIWVVGEWIGIICGVLLIVSAAARYEIGSTFAIIFVVVFGIWNFSGAIIIIASLISTPTCMPYMVSRGLGGFAVFLIVMTVLGVCMLCTQGIGAFNSHFVNRRENIRRMEEIEAGNLDAGQLVRNNRGLDNAPLFADELAKLVQYCTSDYNPQQRRPGEDTCCAVCMDDFQEHTRVLNFPICEHIFHESCIMEWLKTRSTCPMCRQGVRSSLYQKIQQANQNRDIYQGGPQPIGGDGRPAEAAPLIDQNANAGNMPPQYRLEALR